MKGRLLNLFHGDFPGIDIFVGEVVRPIIGDDIRTVDVDQVTKPEYSSRAEKAGIKHMVYVADIEDKKLNATAIALFDVTLYDHKDIERSRVNIQQVIRSVVDSHRHILIVFHYENVAGRPWRFSYAFKRDTASRSTSAKRFTYVFGEGFTGRTAAERFVILKNSEHTDKDFEEAFSVDRLSDEFFDLYRAYYAVFVQYITGEQYSDEKKLNNIIRHFDWLEADGANQFATTFGGDAKAARDYIKKMFGRIIFLYFLQRKGWLYDDNDVADPHYMRHLFEDAGERQNTFLDDVLETLFFYVLNTEKVDDRRRDAAAAGRDITVVPGWQYIPYLNGGLFSQDEIDPRVCTFPAGYFRELFTFLDSYNFTIDENDQEDAEVGIDPEMLGRIFENLLEDNNDKGAFYTPKPIVEYMCRESIIAYLQDERYSAAGNELIRKFVETQDVDLLNEAQRDTIEKKLRTVKICDPAIGSGAFPMGLVNIMSKLFIVLGTFPTAEQGTMKRHIMEQNIYGVDIEQGAVDIARLRFWLAMVVDEDVASPLPNLHFKIMQGNSLLESYKGKDLSRLTEVRMGGSDSLNLECYAAKELIHFLKKFYNESHHGERERILNTITSNVLDQIHELTQNESFMDDVKDISANDRFFLWHTWFVDVFEQGGFDIVIGNPPYIQLQKSIGVMAKDKRGRDYELKLGDLYSDAGYEVFAKTGDIYCLFYEQGFKLLNAGGHLCYITSNKWMRAGYGDKLREFFATKTNPAILLDFGGVQVFESATVDTNILLFAKGENKGSTRAATATKDLLDGGFNLSNFMEHNAGACDFRTSQSWTILSPIEQSIKRKIEAVGVPLREWDINIYRGILTGCNEAFIIPEAKRDEILRNCADEAERQRTEELIRPILRGRDIKRYGYEDSKMFLIATFPARNYDIDQYPAVKSYLLSFAESMLREAGLDWVADSHLADFCLQKLAQTGQYVEIAGQRIHIGSEDEKARKRTSNKWFETQDSISYWEDFNKSQIVWIELSDKPKFAFVENMVSLNTVFFMTGSNLRHILGQLNSKLITWYFHKCLGARSGVGTNRWLKYTIEQLPLAPYDNSFSKLVENYSLDNDEAIDIAVCDLFSLSEDEKRIVLDYSLS